MDQTSPYVIAAAVGAVGLVWYMTSGSSASAADQKEAPVAAPAVKPGAKKVAEAEKSSGRASVMSDAKCWAAPPHRTADSSGEDGAISKRMAQARANPFGDVDMAEMAADITNEWADPDFPVGTTRTSSTNAPSLYSYPRDCY
jgi:hypothetical protein